MGRPDNESELLQVHTACDNHLTSAGLKDLVFHLRLPLPLTSLVQGCGETKRRGGVSFPTAGFLGHSVEVMALAGLRIRHCPHGGAEEVAGRGRASTKGRRWLDDLI